MSEIYQVLQSFDPVVISILSLFIFFLMIVVFFYWWGETGLYLYIAVAVIGANFQVLKVSYFGFMEEPVALGTVLFASTYLCTDILNEYFGPKSARRGVMIGFVAMLFWTVITQLTLGYAPLTLEQAGNDYQWALGTHDHMKGVFSIFPAIFVAGISAYLISQWNDVFLYNKIRKLTGNRFIWLRNNVSTIVSALLDNCIFSFIAFWLLAENPVKISTLLVTYVFGTYLIRVVVALFDTPFLYLTRWLIPRAPHD